VVLALTVRVRVIRTACSAWGKPQPAGGAHGDRFDGAGFAAAVPGVAAAVADRHLRPGQGLELGVQGGLVRLDRDEQVRAPGGDVAGVAGLGDQHGQGVVDGEPGPDLLVGQVRQA
jgi:hypothetical protein